MGDEDQGPSTNPQGGMTDRSTNEKGGRSGERTIGGSHWTIGREERCWFGASSDVSEGADLHASNVHGSKLRRTGIDGTTTTSRERRNLSEGGPGPYAQLHRLFHVRYRSGRLRRLFPRTPVGTTSGRLDVTAFPARSCRVVLVASPSSVRLLRRRCAMAASKREVSWLPRSCTRFAARF